MSRDNDYQTFRFEIVSDVLRKLNGADEVVEAWTLENAPYSFLEEAYDTISHASDQLFDYMTREEIVALLENEL